MKVKASSKVVAHKGEEFLDKEAGTEFHVNDAELLKALTGLVQIIDHYPQKADYKVEKAYGNHKAGDIVTLYSDQVTALILAGRIVPVDDKLWRPGMPLPESSRSFLRRIVDAAL